MTLTDAERRRYARQIILPEFGLAAQERLKSASVLLIGGGGLGSPAALYLAAAGVGRLGIVDADSVDESNLHRQVLYGQSTIGAAKVEAARDRLRDVNPHVQIEAHRVRLTSENAEAIVSQYDVVLDGTDNFPTRYLVNDVCVKLGKPNVFAGVLRFEGQLSVFDAREGPCYRCVFPEPPPAHLAPSCAEAGVLGVLPGIMGTMQAAEAIKLLAGVGEPAIGRVLLFEGLALGVQEFQVSKNPHCAACADPQAVVLTDMPDAFCSAQFVTHMAPRDLKEKLRAQPNVPIVDVRTPQEFSAGSLPGAIHLELQTLIAAASGASEGADVLQRLSGEDEVVVLCRAGGRSRSAIDALVAAGWAPNKLINLDGGLLAWAQQVDPTLRVP